jgi:hypothetical protein
MDQKRPLVALTFLKMQLDRLSIEHDLDPTANPNQLGVTGRPHFTPLEHTLASSPTP